MLQLSTRVVAMGLLFPAIIHRLESYLTALEFCKEINIDVGSALALEAVTKDSDNTDETHGERINFQRGMGSNYERLEFIGDCFLKMATSISLFARFASNDEYAMHVDRMLMVCNKNMFDNAKKSEWFRYIRGLSFSRYVIAFSFQLLKSRVVVLSSIFRAKRTELSFRHEISLPGLENAQYRHRRPCSSRSRGYRRAMRNLY